MAEVDSSQDFCGSNGRVDQTPWVALRVGAVQRGWPWAPDGHWLALPLQSDEELNQSSGVLKRLSNLQGIFGKGARLVEDVVQSWAAQ